MKNKGPGNKRPRVGDKAKETLESLDENNPVILMFKGYSKELDDRHDRHERIIKLSRDVTIESKRIIFLLHNVNADLESKKEAIVDEAERRLKVVINTNFKAIAKELQGHDHYLYHRAYTFGIQEFVEAVVFCQFLKRNDIGTWNDVNSSFQYEENDQKFDLMFSYYDFIFGIADFTGELMRRCINSLGIGNIDDCFKLCDFVKHINTGFLGSWAPGNKEMSRKAYVLRQSLSKMELVCYNIQIRGSEIPKHMLMSVIESSQVAGDEDEGFF